jgi:hypothetical protein
MSQMACLCGGTIRDNLIPCPTEGWLLRDQDQDAYYDDACRDIASFFTAIHAGRRGAWIAEYFSAKYPSDSSDEDIVTSILHFHKRPVFLSVAECEQCGRLLVQRGPGVNSYHSYAPDEPGYAGVLRAREQLQPDPARDAGS